MDRSKQVSGNTDLKQLVKIFLIRHNLLRVPNKWWKLKIHWKIENFWNFLLLKFILAPNYSVEVNEVLIREFGTWYFVYKFHFVFIYWINLNSWIEEKFNQTTSSKWHFLCLQLKFWSTCWTRYRRLMELMILCKRILYLLFVMR